MYRIKIQCIVTLILEMTRRLENEQAQLLENFCDNVLLSRKDQRYTFNSLTQLKKQKVDLLSIKRVKSAPIKKERRTEDFLFNLF